MSANLAREGPWIPENSFGVRLRMLRHELHLSVEEAARLCGITHSTWSYWERGGRPQRMDEVVKQIADATGVYRDWLMWGSSNIRYRQLTPVDMGIGPMELPLVYASDPFYRPHAV